MEINYSTTRLDWAKEQVRIIANRKYEAKKRAERISKALKTAYRTNTIIGVRQAEREENFKEMALIVFIVVFTSLVIITVGA